MRLTKLNLDTLNFKNTCRSFRFIISLLPTYQNHSTFCLRRSAIVEEMLLGSECTLKFTGIHLRPGMLVVDAVNKHSAEWLV